MEAKHTPGPWELRTIDTADVRGAVHVYAGGAAVTTDVWGRTLPESDANARLIAAAPDLLAFAESVESILGDRCECPTSDAQTRAECPFCRLVMSARSAIARARGAS